MPFDALIAYFLIYWFLTVGGALVMSNWATYRRSLRAQLWWQLPHDRRAAYLRSQVLMFVGVTTLFTVWNPLSHTHIRTPLEFTFTWGEVAIILGLLYLLGSVPGYLWYVIVRRRTVARARRDLNTSQ